MQTNDLNFNCASFVEYYHFFCFFLVKKKIVCTSTENCNDIRCTDATHRHCEPFLFHLKSFTIAHMVIPCFEKKTFAWRWFFFSQLNLRLPRFFSHTHKNVWNCLMTEQRASDNLFQVKCYATTSKMKFNLNDQLRLYSIGFSPLSRVRLCLVYVATILGITSKLKLAIAVIKDTKLFFYVCVER